MKFHVAWASNDVIDFHFLPNQKCGRSLSSEIEDLLPKVDTRIDEKKGYTHEWNAQANWHSRTFHAQALIVCAKIAIVKMYRVSNYRASM